jgi:hypothetical protein
MQERETLGGVGIDSGSPTLGSDRIYQDHKVYTLELATGSVDVPDATMYEEETFDTGTLDTAQPVNGSPLFNQDQTFETDNLEAQAIVPSATMYEEETLSAREPVINNPSTSSADFTQGHNLATVIFIGPVLVPDATMYEEETLGAVNINATPSVPSTFMYEDETFDTGDLDTDSVVVPIPVITQGHNLAPEGPTTAREPVVDRTNFLQDHNFDTPELLGEAYILPPPFWDPAFAREVNVETFRIGTKTTIKGGNTANIRTTNRVKIG